MFYTIFLVSIVMVFVNLPWALNGSTPNIVSMIVCAILAAVHLALASQQKHEEE